MLPDGFQEREEFLIRMRYTNNGHYSDIRLRDAEIPANDYHLPTGFNIRAVKDKTDFEKISSAIRLVFGHGKWFTAEILEEMTTRSFYVKDLDLVVESENGDIAAFCTFRMDPTTKITQLEPLGTHPNFRILGLAYALIQQGIARAKSLGASLFYIAGAALNPAVIKLYDKTFYSKVLKEFIWNKYI